MIKIRLILDKTKQKQHKDNTHPIVLLVCEPNQKPVPFVIQGMSCHADQFDATIGRFTNKYPKYATYNRILQQQEDKAHTILASFIKKNERFDIGKFKNDFFDVKSNLTVEEVFDYFIKQMYESEHVGNATVFVTCRNRVKAFAPTAKLSQITVQWLIDFEHYLKTKSKETIKDTSISNYLRTFRALLNKAIEKGFMDAEDYPFGKGKFSFNHLNLQTRPRALSKEWIQAIESLELMDDKPITQTRNNLIFARDIFLFSYFSFGMNFSDMAHLKKADIKLGRTEFIRKKTHTPHSIATHPKAKIILKKYAETSCQDYAFPILNDVIHSSMIQKKNRVKTVLKDVNSSLKQITEKLGIDNLNMSSYVSRHSFANIVRKNGATLEEISELLQHKDINTTRIYLESLTDEQKDKWLDVL